MRAYWYQAIIKWSLSLIQPLPLFVLIRNEIESFFSRRTTYIRFEENLLLVFCFFKKNRSTGRGPTLPEECAQK